MSRSPVRHYVAVTAAAVDDLALLPKRFDQFTGEVRTSFELLGKQIMPALLAQAAAVEDLDGRVRKLEQVHTTLHERVTKLERRESDQVVELRDRVAALEQTFTRISKPRAAARPKKSPPSARRRREKDPSCVA